MKRRDFITLLGGAAAAWPLAARAQQPDRVRRIGVLMAHAESDPFYQSLVQTFRTRLQDLGWTDGVNLRIYYRWTAGVAERFQTAAAELVALKPDAILADATPSVTALRRETQTIPIVFLLVTDPVAQGLVESLAHPGANVTGFQMHEHAMGGKWLSLLKEAAPHVTRIGVIFNPITAPYGPSYLPVIEATASQYQVTAIQMLVQSGPEIDAAITGFAREPNGGMILMPDSFLVVHADRILELAMQYRLPMIADSPYWTKIGGLIAYGPDLVDMFRGAATNVDRILRGAKPAELPVQVPTKFELVINLEGAKAIGLTIPETLLVRADEVIDQ
jgi:putative tryptophan/tyrosine transport system substrate-binding protein